MAASPLFPKLPPSWQEESLKTQDGNIHIRIFRHLNLSLGRLLFIVHGQAEQSDRYEHFAHYLNGTVDAIACLDLPGHGLSAGKRGHIENFNQYDEAALSAFNATRQWMLQRAAVCHTHWFGHSLGGLITLHTLLRNTDLPLKSVISSAPLLDLAFPVPKIKKFFGELIEPFWGSLHLSNELNSDSISHDPSVAKAYQENPLNHQFVTPRFFVQMTRARMETSQQQGPFSYPLLMVIPLSDPIVSAPESLRFFEKLRMKDNLPKKLVTFPGFFHESFNEVNKDLAFNALDQWIQCQEKTSS